MIRSMGSSALLAVGTAWAALVQSDPWAFRPPVKLPIPAAAHANPIDALARAEHARRGVTAGPAAPPALLLRRVYLDLVGLPPTREQVLKFRADPSPEAYGRVVDELLQSPHHGERWGRHFMDVWRYCDWYGLDGQLRYSQKHLWHWRDWIVESLNADKPYDRMIVEMLAADETAPADTDALRATGYLARNYFLFNRTTWLDATIEHTARAFLGLTLQCAKCHDHKYDPISQTDYYRMRAVFEPHQVRLDSLPGQTDLDKDGLPRAYDAHPEAPTYLHVQGDEKRPDTSAPVPPGVPERLARFAEFCVEPVALPPEAHTPGLQPHVRTDHEREALRVIDEARDALRDAPEPERAAAEQRLAAAERRLEAVRLADAALRDPALASEAAAAEARWKLAAAEADVAAAERAAASAEREKKLKEARERLEAARKRAANPGGAFTPLPATLKALEGPDETEDSRRKPYPAVSTGRRTALARWIVDPRNPLTARVIVNHVWMRHLGRPLVAPVDDLGARTPRPPLADVLDWLAVDLIEHGWSLKHLHRRIVTSELYARAASGGGADPALFARREPSRLEAEVIRDAMLLLAGRLDPTVGGPTIDPKQADTSTRRSLYFAHSREERHPFLAMFDSPDVAGCYRRTESIQPQQALAMANSAMVLDLAGAIAGRLGGDSDDAFIEAAFETILSVPPDATERTACREALERWNAIEPSRARRNLVHALLNHHDFITVR
jgi:hypothetical protein